MRNDLDPNLSAKLLQVICQLHEWESQHLDLATTQAGRYLYPVTLSASSVFAVKMTMPSEG